MFSAERASPPLRRAIELDELRREVGVEIGRAASHDLLHVLLRQRLELVDLQRDSSAELTSKYGFSVVAPISVTSPPRPPAAARPAAPC